MQCNKSQPTHSSEGNKERRQKTSLPNIFISNWNTHTTQFVVVPLVVVFVVLLLVVVVLLIVIVVVVSGQLVSCVVWRGWALKLCKWCKTKDWGNELAPTPPLPTLPISMAASMLRCTCVCNCADFFSSTSASVGRSALFPASSTSSCSMAPNVSVCVLLNSSMDCEEGEEEGHIWLLQCIVGCALPAYLALLQP